VRFYSLRELKGSPVIDSEALLYGFVSGLEISEEGAYLEVSERVRDPETEREVEHAKGRVPIGEISAIAEGPEGPVVLLSSPREASYRGVSPAEPTPADLERAPGKLVIAVDGKVLGRVEEVVVGPREPGLRVRAKGASEVAWLRFIRDLKSRDRGLASKLEARMDPYKNPRIPEDRMEYLRGILREEGASEEVVELMDSYLEEKPGATVDIPWSAVLKVGDVILVGGLP